MPRPISHRAVTALLLAPFLVAGTLGLRAGEAEDQLSSHREKLGALHWHAAGHRGKGVKVCVLDTDFAGFRAELGQTLPWKVRARSFREDGSLESPRSAHGLRSAQVVHALAPAAELLLANWDPHSPDSFLDAVRWARGQGARVISCSVTSAAWGDGEGGGPIHRRLGELLGKGGRRDDPLFFCSAGNMALGHWAGPFTGAELHQWKPGEIDNWLTPFGEVRVKVSLLHKPGSVYELLVYDGLGRHPIARQTSEREAELAGPALSFAAQRGRQYRLRVRLVSGKPGKFHCVVRYATLQLASLHSSVCCFPADNPAVVTVGAIDWAGRREDYSACGGLGGRLKPEFVAPVPFPCPGRDSSFGGTSAAAPQAAGLSALLADRHADWTARQLREALVTGVRSATKPAHDPETGHGMIRLPAPR